jgi:hypothetical protein
MPDSLFLVPPMHLPILFLLLLLLLLIDLHPAVTVEAGAASQVTASIKCLRALNLITYTGMEAETGDFHL